MASMFGRTRESHGIFHSVPSANMRCMSTQICTAVPPGRPYLSLSLFAMASSPESRLQRTARGLVPVLDKGCACNPASPAAMSGKAVKGRKAPSASEPVLDGRGRSPCFARGSSPKAETNDSGAAGARAKSPRAATRQMEPRTFARSWGCAKQIQSRR